MSAQTDGCTKSTWHRIRRCPFLALSAFVMASVCLAGGLLEEFEETEGPDEILAEEGEKEALELLAALREVEKRFPLRGAAPARGGAKDDPGARAQAAAAKARYLATRRKAFEAKAAELRQSLLRESAGRREKILGALAVVLVRQGEGEPAIQAAILIDGLKTPALAEPLRRALAAAIERLGDQTALLPKPIIQCLANLGGRFSRTLGELDDGESLPLALKAWEQEAERLDSCNALQALVRLAGREQRSVFEDAFQSARTSEGKHHALRGLCRFGPDVALRHAVGWLGVAIRGNRADEMQHVRSALDELPAAAGDLVMAFLKERLPALKPLGSRTPAKRAEQFAALEIALLVGLRLADAEVLALLARQASPETGGALHRRAAARALGLYPMDAPCRLVSPKPARQVALGAFDLRAPIAGPRGKLAEAGKAAEAHGSSYRVLAGGRDVRTMWPRLYGDSLKITARDLSGDGWADAPAARNELLIDLRRGRLKFPTGEARQVQVLGKTVPGKALFFEWPDRVVLRGKYAYMSCGENWDAGLVKVDISDPKNPRIVGHSYVGGFARGVQLYGDYAYVANTNGGFFTVFRVSTPDDPAHFRWVGRVKGLSGPGLGVNQERGLLLAIAGNQLRIMGLTDPEKPKPIGSMTLRGGGSEVRSVGNLACVAAGAGGIQLIDLSDPKQPKELAHVPLDNAHDVELHDGLAYVCDIKQGIIAILDVQKPSAPREVARVEGLNRNGIRFDVVERDDKVLLFVAQYGGGDVRIFDVTDRTTPRPIGRWVNSSPWKGLLGRGGNLADVTVQGNVAVVTNLCYGLHVLDVSDPTKPVLVGEVRAAGEAGNLRVMDDRTVVVEDFCQACLVFDTADAAKMEIVGHYPFGGRCWPGLALKRPYAYISHQFPAGITAIDLSDRRHPRPTCYLNTRRGLGSIDMVASGDYAYVVHRYGYNVVVLDLRDPANPKQLAESNPGSTTSLPFLDATEDVLLVANHGDAGPGPLSIWDITQPAFIRKIAELQFEGGGCSRVSAQGDLAWCAGSGRLRAVDLSNPFSPRVLADIPASLGHVIARGGYLYATSGTRLAVYRIPPWPPESGKWASLKKLELIGQTDRLHPRWLCAMDVRGPRAYAVAYNQLFCVQVPWSQIPPEPVSVVLAGQE